MPFALIVHGSYGHPQENWFPWLKTELEKSGHRVFAPQFPTPDFAPLSEQTFENWQKVFAEYEKYLDENSILIGHSLGVPFILRILENLKKPAKAAFLISGFAELFANHEQFNTGSFVIHRFDWAKIRANCKNFTIFHSDNDPYVPLKYAENMAKNLETKITLVKNAGHFNAAAGYREFPELLENCLALSSLLPVPNSEL